MTKTATTDAATVRYEITVTVTRPVQYDYEAPMAEQAEWRVSADAKRELEREVLQMLRKLDGDCDVEVMSADVTRATCTLCDGDGFGPNYMGNCERCGGSGKELR